MTEILYNELYTSNTLLQFLDKVLSGSSDSNSIRLCGPSHGIFLVFAGLSAYVLSNVSSSACRFRPPGWIGSGSCLLSVNSIPESPVFRASFPIHVGRIRFVSIQFLSGGRPVVRKKFDHHFDWSSLIPTASPYSLLDLFSILVTGTNCNELRGGTNAGGSRLYSDATGVGRSGSHQEQQTHSGDGIS